MLFVDYKGRNIRLSEERWKHIQERHPETVGKEKFIEETISMPDFIQEGNKGELIAIRKYKKPQLLKTSILL
jgi:hypothetical protein